MLIKELQSLGLDVRVLNSDNEEINLKDYGDDDDVDEKRISESELGKSVLENEDDVMYDDEEGVVRDDSEEDDIGFGAEETYFDDVSDDE